MHKTRIPLLFSLGLLLAAPAQAGICTDLLSRAARTVNLLWLKPLNVKWTALSEVCPVGRQARVGVCWIFTYLEPYTAYARKVDLIRPQETLSAEYYFARVVEEWITDPSGPKDIEGGYAERLTELVTRYGFVTTTNYRIPGGRGFAGIDPDALRKKMRELPTYGDRVLYFQELFGDLSAVRTADEARSKWLAENLSWTHEVIGNSGVDELMRQMGWVTGSLDQGIPVGANWRVDDEAYRTLRRLANPGLRKREITPDLDRLHAMTIVGYHADEKGRFRYLLIKNSWGGKFGQGGYAVVDGYFIAKYLSQLLILLPKPKAP